MPTDEHDDDRARGLKQKVSHEQYAQLIKQSDVYYDPNVNQYKSKNYDKNHYVVIS